MTMIYRRMPLLSQPSGGFAYALHHEGSNFIQVGVGYESPNGLQLTHVATDNIHQFHIIQLANAISADGAQSGFVTGKLAAFFDDAEFVALQPAQLKRFAGLLREVYGEAWGHDLDFQPQFVDLEDGERFVWLMYGSDIDKIRLGIGFTDEAEQRHLGDHSYAIGCPHAASYAIEQFVGVSSLYYAKPPGWLTRDTMVNGPDSRAVGIAFLKLADQVWPGKVALPKTG